MLDNSLITTIMKNNIAADKFPEPDKNKTIHDFDRYSENEILGYLHKKYNIPRVELMSPEERNAHEIAALTYRPEKVWTRMPSKEDIDRDEESSSGNDDGSDDDDDDRVQ